MQFIKNNTPPINIFDTIMSNIPRQGSIEIQQDAPHKEHSWHKHPVDEKIIILQGSIIFHVADREFICSPGDVIKLPANTLHSSVATASGAMYIISSAVS